MSHERDDAPPGRQRRTAPAGTLALLVASALVALSCGSARHESTVGESAEARPTEVGEPTAVEPDTNPTDDVTTDTTPTGNVTSDTNPTGTNPTGTNPTGTTPADDVDPPGVTSPTLGSQLRFPALARVANIDRWFAGWADPTRLDDTSYDFQWYVTGDDLDLLARQGFTAVRLALDPAVIADGAGTLRPSRLEQIVIAADRVHAAGMAVIIDAHVWDQENWESPEQLKRIEQIWHQLAPLFADDDPAMTFLELYNEPGFWGDPAAWAPYERSLHAIARAAAPALPIILSGPKSSWVGGLPDSVVVDDPNVIYTIHVYDPFPFTHQNANWAADPGLRTAVGLPFPTTAEACTHAIAGQATPEAQAVAEEYCATGYEEADVIAQLETAAAWAAEHDVALFLGEFGVSPAAPADDALLWLATVANAAERLGIGWGVWSADGPMGLRRQHWDTTLADPGDPAALAALGLHLV